MLLPLILHLVMAVLVKGVPMQPECCETKDVGGVSYTLVGQMDTFNYQCLNDCIYTKDEDPQYKYCFAAGDLEVDCTEDELENSGTEKSPVEETEAPAGCKCGVKKTSRIVGWQETEVNEYPWMSALAYAETGSFFCGGTLIGDRWVVTASHCLFRNPDGTDPLVAEDLDVVLGEHDTADDNESLIPRKSVKVSRIIKHENYNAENSDDDVALLKLSEPVDLNVYTPACVARSGDSFIGQNAWLYGWGATSFGGEYPEKLLEVEVKIVSQDICKIAMAQYDITDGMLCAGGEANKDGCQGDSGGPLTVDKGGQHTLVGDVSWGNACGLEGQYGVYAETAYYRDWIDANIEANGGAQYCTEVEGDEELDLTGIIDPKVFPYPS